MIAPTWYPSRMNRKDILAILSGAAVSVALAATIAALIRPSDDPVVYALLCFVIGLSSGWFVGGPVAVWVRGRL